MNSNPLIAEVADRLLEQEWRRWLNVADLPEGVKQGWTASQCPIRWSMHELLGLVGELHDRPVAELRPAVRQIIAETAFNDTATSIALQDRPEVLDQQVDMAIRVLEKVRRLALAKGQWSESPAAPMMFG